MRYRFVFARHPNHGDMLLTAKRHRDTHPCPPHKGAADVSVDVELAEPLGDDADEVAFAQVQREFPNDHFLLHRPK